MSFLSRLATRSSSGVGPRGVQEILALLGTPQERYATIHVAGTNGKGSTSAMLASCLHAAGYRVGLFTSPHLIRINERIRIDGVPIDLTVLEEAADMLPELIEQSGISLGYVESLTVLALHVFAKENVDIAIIEVGVGGLLDPSNVITPIASVITPISLDHQKLLGDTIEEIALQKAGIIKNNIPVISSIQQPSVSTVLRAQAEICNAPYTEITADHITLHRSGLTGNVFSCFLHGDARFTTSLAGAYQCANAVTALATLDIIKEHFPVQLDALIYGIAHTIWKGRLDILQTHPLIIADGAHNEAGFCALGAFLSEHKLRPHALVGFKEGKNLESFRTHVLPYLESCIITQGNFHPASTADIAAHLPIESTCIDQVADAFAEARTRATKEHPLLICGSLYLLGDIYTLWEGVQV